MCSVIGRCWCKNAVLGQMHSRALAPELSCVDFLAIFLVLGCCQTKSPAQPTTYAVFFPGRCPALLLNTGFPQYNCPWPPAFGCRVSNFSFIGRHSKCSNSCHRLGGRHRHAHDLTGDVQEQTLARARGNDTATLILVLSWVCCAVPSVSD